MKCMMKFCINKGWRKLMWNGHGVKIVIAMWLRGNTWNKCPFLSHALTWLKSNDNLIWNYHNELSNWPLSCTVHCEQLNHCTGDCCSKTGVSAYKIMPQESRFHFHSAMCQVLKFRPYSFIKIRKI